MYSRFFALLFSFVMIFTMIPTTAFAQEINNTVTTAETENHALVIAKNAPTALTATV